MKNIQKFDIQSNGIMSGLPFLCSYLSSVVFCYIADGLLKYELVSLTNVRKIMTASSQVIPGLLVVLVGYLDDLVMIIIIWSIAVMLVSDLVVQSLMSQEISISFLPLADHSKLCWCNGKHRWPSTQLCRTCISFCTKYPHDSIISLAFIQWRDSDWSTESGSMENMFHSLINCCNSDLCHVSSLRYSDSSTLELLR